MFDSVRRKMPDGSGDAVLDIAPLIDMVFILLLFFLVTSSFSREEGMDVKKPVAYHSRSLEPQSLRIIITTSNGVYIAGRRVSLDECSKEVSRFVSNQADGLVVIVPDESVTAKVLVSVMDAAKSGGAVNIAVATRKVEN